LDQKKTFLPIRKRLREGVETGEGKGKKLRFSRTESCLARLEGSWEKNPGLGGRKAKAFALGLIKGTSKEGGGEKKYPPGRGKSGNKARTKKVLDCTTTQKIPLSRLTDPNERRG